MSVWGNNSQQKEVIRALLQFYYGTLQFSLDHRGTSEDNNNIFRSSFVESLEKICLIWYKLPVQRPTLENRNLPTNVRASISILNLRSQALIFTLLCVSLVDSQYDVRGCSYIGSIISFIWPLPFAYVLLDS